ncbi:hypothetical protein Nepgr_020885 [Nepenthes gracilis]|uniref:Uncharacterized protein n=1 Tax=Nepenthes gracilis TaxID=150966 RepID=A0AAD3SXQ7_NEPGR|nr:hypothetical protein Nepgr_020885 [Nepenthes gracilis]
MELVRIQCKFMINFNVVVYIRLPNRLRGFKYVVRTMPNVASCLNAALYHSSELSHGKILPVKWYQEVFPRLQKLSHFLKNVDLVDGRLINLEDNSTIRDERIWHRIHNFKTLARAFLGAPSVQEELRRNMKASMADRKYTPPLCFTKSSEREPIVINSLKHVCNILNISAQQRKVVRAMICPHVTQHKLWTAALEEILKGLKLEMDSMSHSCPTKGTSMAQQIVSSCLSFIDETAYFHDQDSSSWMRPKPVKVVDSPSSHKWEEVLEMFNDLINCLRGAEELLFHVSKLDVMREGLTLIKDVVVNRNHCFKEVRHQESLVQKKLVKALGLSSLCLFTLLQYYLYGTVRDMAVEVSGGLYEVGKEEARLFCMGKVVASDEERMISNGVKELDRKLGLFKFVWETAGMKGSLELQGHIWCVGAMHRTLTYKGKLFFVHGISL